jgi:nitrile hydratase
MERTDPKLVERLRSAISSGNNFRRSVEKRASFAVGDKVRVRSDVSTTHTRRASYVRGRQGEVVAAHGAFPYPDANSSGAGECPEHLYTVRFAADELWSKSADVNAANFIDVWEPYLEAEQ